MIVLLLLLCSGTVAQYCTSNNDCSNGLQCSIQTEQGYGTCLSASIGNGVQPDVQYCSSDRDCPANRVCKVTSAGTTCQQPVYCVTDRDCGQYESCIIQPNRNSICQLTVGGIIGGTTENGRCARDSDCQINLRCVNYYGEVICKNLLTIGNGVSPSKTCEKSSDCTGGQVCIFRKDEPNLCMWLGGDAPNVGGNINPTTTVPVGGNINPNFNPTVGGVMNPSNTDNNNNNNNRRMFEQPTSNVVDQTLQASIDSYRVDENALSESVDSSNASQSLQVPTYDLAKVVPRQLLIDPAATACQFDYHCRMGESCSAVIQLVDRNITVCQYDVTKTDRLCIYHSDCLQGQMCTNNASGSSVCQNSIEAAKGNVECLYDYQCSGGETCQKAGDDYHQKFMCRIPEFPDPRRNQKCSSNIDCPYQQVCRQVGETMMCVDISATVGAVHKGDVAKIFYQFIKDLFLTRS